MFGWQDVGIAAQGQSAARTGASPRFLADGEPETGGAIWSGGARYAEPACAGDVCAAGHTRAARRPPLPRLTRCEELPAPVRGARVLRSRELARGLSAPTVSAKRENDPNDGLRRGLRLSSDAAKRDNH